MTNNNNDNNELQRKKSVYSEDMIEISEKYRIKKNVVKYILNKYGSMDEFIKQYRKHQLDDIDMDLAREHVRTYIDIDETDHDLNYSRLLDDIYGKTSKITFYSSDAINKILSSMPSRYLKSLQERYGLNDGLFKTYEKVSESQNISRQGARLQIVYIIDKIRSKKAFWDEIFPTQKTEKDNLVSSAKLFLNKFKNELDRSGYIFKSIEKPDVNMSMMFKEARDLFENEYFIKNNAGKDNIQFATEKKENNETLFIRQYRNGELKDDDLKIAEATIRSYIDIDENPYFENYEALVEEIYGKKNEITFFSSKGIHEAIDTFTPCQQNIIREHYGLVNLNLLSYNEQVLMQQRYGIQSIKTKSLEEIAYNENIDLSEAFKNMCEVIRYIRNDSAMTKKIMPINEKTIRYCSPEELEIINQVKEKIDMSPFANKGGHFEYRTEKRFFSNRLMKIRSISENINKIYELRRLSYRRKKLREKALMEKEKIKKSDKILIDCEKFLGEKKDKNKEK